MLNLTRTPEVIREVAAATRPIHDEHGAIVYWATPWGSWHSAWTVAHLSKVIHDPATTLTERRQAGAVLAWRDVHDRSWWMRLMARWPE